MEDFRVERQTDIPLRFKGVLLADLSSRENGHQTRWQEIRIYKTATNKYVTEVVGQTTHNDERVFRTVTVCEHPDDVRQALKRRAKGGREFLNDMAFEALEMAGEIDPAIGQSILEEVI